ncbi:hypothetical protein C8F01DRAFT_1092026 [Mycena amicta]|nr:hypothetical protein C8F01DRAFT_1092026 [Mycena amicta]
MPEANEAHAAAFVAQRGLDIALSQGESLQVQSIVFDPTDTEREKAKYAAGTLNGLPLTFEPSFLDVMRGNTTSQNDLFGPLHNPASKQSKSKSATPATASKRPRKAVSKKKVDKKPKKPRKSSKENLDPTSKSEDNTDTVPLAITLMHLHGFHPHLRGIILNLGIVFLGVPVSHGCHEYSMTAVDPLQPVFSPKTRGLSVQVRGFRIGIAFVFEHRVFAVVSHDNMFQPTWNKTLEAFGIPPSPTKDRDRWLANAKEWVTEQLKSRSEALAAFVIRENKTIWEGAGVYTVSEIFFLAGLRGSTTIRQLVRNPSAIARLLCAFYTHVKFGAEHARSIVSASMVDGILAPTDDQKSAESHYLHVHGKEHTMISQRMYDTITYHAELDALEPALIDAEILALFAPAIFGTAQAEKLGFSATAYCSSFLAAYTQEGVSAVNNTSTNLRSDIYDTIFRTPNELRARKADVTAHRVGAGKGCKQFWTVFKETHLLTNFPLLRGYRKYLFLHLSLYTSKEAIGLLEYCSSGFPVTFGGVTRAMACQGDPQFSNFHHERRHVGQKRANIIMETNHGRRKRGWEETEMKLRNDSLPLTLAAADAGRVVLEARAKKRAAPDDEVPRVIKRRKGADAAIREQFKSIGNIF